MAQKCPKDLGGITRFGLCKHMITVPDSTLDEVMAFLDEAERHGKEIVTQLGDDGQGRTLTTEARMIKKMFIKLRDL